MNWSSLSGNVRKPGLKRPPVILCLQIPSLGPQLSL